MCELAPQKSHTAMGTLWNMSEGAVFILLTLFFRFVSKEWRWSVAIGILECLIGYTLLYLIVPESPKWQYDQGHYKNCYKTLQYMARFNKAGKHLPEQSKLMMI